MQFDYSAAPMSYETACEIHDRIETTRDELRFDFYRAAARYAALRTAWHLASPDERREIWTRNAPPRITRLLMH